MKAAGIIDQVLESLNVAGIAYTEFNKVLPDPPAEVVDEGAKLCKAEECDCVIGIGGGSAIDTAKGINILRVNGGSILDYADPEKEMKKSLGLMSVPTTSGTGSEMSSGLIISDTANNSKVAILVVNGMSEFAVIDPAFAAGMPLGLTIMTGLDVFSHAAEGYTSALANPMTDMINRSIDYADRCGMSAARSGGWNKYGSPHKNAYCGFAGRMDVRKFQRSCGTFHRACDRRNVSYSTWCMLCLFPSGGTGKNQFCPAGESKEYRKNFRCVL